MSESIFEDLALEETQTQVASAAQATADVVIGWGPDNPVPGADYSVPFQPLDDGSVLLAPGEEAEIVPALGGRTKVIVVNVTDDPDAVVWIRLGATATENAGLPLWGRGGKYEDFVNCTIRGINPGTDPLRVNYQGLGTDE